MLVRCPVLAAATLALSLPSVGTLAHESHLDHDTPPELKQAEPHDFTQRQAFTHFLAKLTEPKVRMEIRGDRRLLAANGLPDHATGQFPNRGNPNTIASQRYEFQMPLDPPPPATDPDTGQLRQPRDTGRYVFGVALNGVPFDPGTAENWTAQGLQRGGRSTGWKYEALGGAIQLGVDHANAHVQPTGAYHYHGIPTPLLKPNAPTLLGYAADGYPIYGPLGHENPNDLNSQLIKLSPSWQLKTNDRPATPAGPGGQPDGSFTQDWQYVPNLGDLDQANGRFAATPEYPDGTYHYVLTEAFPHIPRHFAGTPDDSFRKRGGARGGDRPERAQRPERHRPPRQ